MKSKTSYALLGFLFSGIQFIYATVHTVNNSPNNPGQFSQIDAAIAAANPGDTIYVQGSAATYSNATVTKSITLIGPGAFNQTDLQLRATVGGININGGLTGVTIRGFYADIISANYANQLHQLTISHCLLNNQIGLGSMVNSSDIIVYNNIINVNGTAIEVGATTVAQGNSNFIFMNNILRGSIAGLVITNAIVQNNIFLTSNPAFSSICSGAIINNNIFATANPSANTVGCVFNNNLTYSPSTTLPLLGGTNLDNIDPMFVNVPDFNAFFISYNYHLQPTSPGHNAGNDGTDIGIYGGQGFSVTTSGEVYNVPVVRKMDIQNTNVPQNGNVNVKVRSTKSRTN